MRDEEISKMNLRLKRAEYSGQVRQNRFRTLDALLTYISDMKLCADEMDTLRRSSVSHHTSDMLFRNLYQESVVTSNLGENRNISRFRLDHLHESNKLTLKLFNISLENMIDFISKHNYLSVNDNFLQEFILRQVEVLDVIKLSLDYCRYENNTGFDESDLQKIFELYSHDLLDKFSIFIQTNSQENYNNFKRYEVHAVNGLYLQTKIMISGNDFVAKEVCLKGHSDIAFCDKDAFASTELKESLQDYSTIIGELKCYGGNLASTESAAVSCSYQVIGETLALSDMRLKSVSSNRITKSFLSDMNSIRLVHNLRNKQDKKKSTYLVSSLFEGSQMFIVCILFLLTGAPDECFEEFMGEVFSLEEDEKSDLRNDNADVENNDDDNNNTVQKLDEQFEKFSMGKKGGKGGGNEKQRTVLGPLNPNYLDDRINMKYDENKLEIVYIGDDEDQSKIEERLKNLQEFEMARFGLAYLSAESLARLT